VTVGGNPSDLHVPSLNTAFQARGWVSIMIGVTVGGNPSDLHVPSLNTAFQARGWVPMTRTNPSCRR